MGSFGLAHLHTFKHMAIQLSRWDLLISKETQFLVNTTPNFHVLKNWVSRLKECQLLLNDLQIFAGIAVKVEM